MSGRKGTAPCGHEGEYVIGTYVRCPRCDAKAVPTPVEPEKTEPLFAPWRCPHCHGKAWYSEYGVDFCVKCGRIKSCLSG